MMTFDVRKWYWVVAGDDSRVWSSAAGQYLPVSDTGYQQWLSAGNFPTRIASEAELREVIIQQAPDLAGIMTPEQFFDEFTPAQWAAIKAAAATDLDIEYMLDRLRVVRSVDPASETVTNGLAYLVSQGLIDQADADRITSRALRFEQ